jgi:hypothetical protein
MQSFVNAVSKSGRRQKTQTPQHPREDDIRKKLIDALGREVGLLSDLNQVSEKLRDEQNTGARLNGELTELQENLILANTKEREGSVLREKVNSSNLVLEKENDALTIELTSLKLKVDGLSADNARLTQQNNDLFTAKKAVGVSMHRSHG